MKNLIKLVNEYKIRFNVTDKIKESGNPFGSDIFFNKGGHTPEICEKFIMNNNGVVYDNEIWATADIEKLPELWVVEKDENSPYWADFLDMYYFDDKFKYYSKVCGSDELTTFIDHQYLTLNQWHELSRSKSVDYILSKSLNSWLYANIDSADYLIKLLSDKKTMRVFDINYMTMTHVPLSKDNICEIRPATEEELEILYSNYPEHRTPKKGDCGIFFDFSYQAVNMLESRRIIIQEFDKGVSPYFYDTFGCKWRRFYSINMNLPLQPQIDKLKEKLKEDEQNT